MSIIAERLIEKIRHIPRVLNFPMNFDDIIAINYGSKAQRIPAMEWMPNSAPELTVMGGKADLENALKMAEPQLEGGVPTLLVMLQTNTIPEDKVEPVKALLTRYKKKNDQMYILAVGSESRNDTVRDKDDDDRLNLKKLQPPVDVIRYLTTNDASTKDSFAQILPLLSKPLNSFRGT